MPSSVTPSSSDMAFSKYETYATAGSLYCYPDTNVLRNKLHIRDFSVLKAAEEEITALKQYELLLHPIKGRFSKTHLCRIHRFLFGDIYSFAGHLRREQIGKANTWFYPPAMIDKELTSICRYVQETYYFRNLSPQDLFERLAFIMAELNVIHPFREGNGRAIREFIRLLALKNDFTLNWGLADRNSLLFASIQSIDDYHYLIPVLTNCIQAN